jgi:hypothetical protein
MPNRTKPVNDLDLVRNLRFEDTSFYGDPRHAPEVSRTDEKSMYDKGYIPTSGDVNDYRALNQGWFDKSLRYTGQGVSTFGTALLETIAAVGSLAYAAPKAGIDALSGKETKFLEDWISNPVMQGIEDLNKWVQTDLLPGYERQSDNLWSSGTEFYRDFMNGVGFAASSLVGTGAIVKLGGMAGRAAAGSGKILAEASKVKRGLSTVEKLTDAAKAMDALKSTAKVQRFFNNWSVLTGSIVARLGESAIEANGAIDEFIHDNPNAAPEQIDQIRRDVFLANMGLSLIDAYQFSRMFGGYKALMTGFKNGERKLANTISKEVAGDFFFNKETAKYALKELSKPRRILKTVGDFSTMGITEMYEEVSQYNFTDISHRIALGEIPNDIQTRVGEFVKGVANPASTQEELKSAILGALLGIVMEGGAKAMSQPTATQKKAQRESILKELNEQILNLPVLGETDRYTETEFNGKKHRVLKKEYLDQLNSFSFIEEQIRSILSDEVVTKRVTTEQKEVMKKLVTDNPHLSENQKKEMLEEVEKMNFVENPRVLTGKEKEAEVRKLRDLQWSNAALAHLEAGRFENYREEMSYLLGGSPEEMMSFTGAKNAAEARSIVEGRIKKLDEIADIYADINSDYLFGSLPPSFKRIVHNLLVHQSSIVDQINENLVELTNLQSQLDADIRQAQEVSGEEKVDITTINPELTKKIKEIQDANKAMMEENIMYKKIYNEWRTDHDKKVKETKDTQDEIDRKKAEKEAEKLSRELADTETLNEFFGENQEMPEQGTEISTSTYNRRLFLEVDSANDFYAVSRDGKRVKITPDWIRKQKARLLTKEESQTRDTLEQYRRNREERITALEKLVEQHKKEVKGLQSKIESVTKDGLKAIENLSKIPHVKWKSFAEKKRRLEKLLVEYDEIISSLENAKAVLEETIEQTEKSIAYYKELRKTKEGIPSLDQDLDLVLQRDANIEQDLPTLQSLYEQASSLLPGLRKERDRLEDVINAANDMLDEHVAIRKSYDDIDFAKRYRLDNLDRPDRLRRLHNLFRRDEKLKREIREADENVQWLEQELEASKAAHRNLSERIQEYESMLEYLPKKIEAKQRINKFLEQYDALVQIIDKNLEDNLRKKERTKMKTEASDNFTSDSKFADTMESWEEDASSPDFLHTTGDRFSDSPNQKAWQRLLSNNESLDGYLQFHDATSSWIREVDRKADPNGIWITYHKPKDPEPWKDGEIVAYTSIPREEGSKLKISDKQLLKAAHERGLVDPEMSEADVLTLAKKTLVDELIAFKKEIQKNLKEGNKVFHKADILTKGHLPTAKKIETGKRAGHHKRHSIVDTIPEIASETNKLEKINDLAIQVNTSFGNKNSVFFDLGSTVHEAEGLPRGGVFLYDRKTNTIIQLRNRKLNQREVGTVLALINEYKDKTSTDTHNFADKSSFNPRYLHTDTGMINSVIMWGQAGEIGVKNVEDQIFFKDGKLYFGKDGAYTHEQIQEATTKFFTDSQTSDPLIDFLRDRYHQVNQRLVNLAKNNRAKYSAVYAEKTGDGTYKLKRIANRTYKEYLVLGMEGLQTNKKIINNEGETDAPLSTNLREYDPKIPFRSNRQVVLSREKLQTREPKESKEVQKEEKPAPTELNEPPVKSNMTDRLRALAKKEEAQEQSRKEDSGAKADPFSIFDDFSDKDVSDPNSIDPSDAYGDDLLRKVNAPYVPVDLSSEVRWFVQKFPGVPIKVIERMLGENTFGRFHKNMVEVYQKAQEGTVYHEGFHVVSQLFLTPHERERIYNEFKNRPDAQEKINKVRELYGDKHENYLIEEALAEEFTEYMLLDGQLDIPRAQRNFFQKLWNFIKNFFTGKDSESNIEQLYKRIKDTPSFGRPIFISDNTFERKLTIRGRELSASDTKAIYEGFNFAFFRSLMKEGGNPLDIDTNVIDTVELYNNALNEFQSLSDKLGIKYLRNLDAQSRLDLVNYHKEQLKQYGMKMVEMDEDGNPLQFDPEDFSVIDDPKQGVLGRPHIEFDTRDGAPKAVKLLVMSTPQIVIKDGKPSLYLNQGKFPKLANFGSLWNFIAQNLAEIPEGYENFIKELQTLQAKRPEIGALLKKLEKVSGPNASRFRTQFVQSFAKARHTYNLVMERKDGSLVTIDSNSNKLEDSILEEWRSAVKEKATLGKDGRYVFPESVFTKSGRKFLDAIGVEVSGPMTAEMLTGINSLSEHMHKLQNAGESVVDIFNIDQRGRLKALAEHEARFTDKVVDLQLYNTENRLVHSIAFNSEITLRAKELSYYAGNLDALQAAAPWLFTDPYVQNSLLKAKLLQGVKIKIDILDGGRVDQAGLKGKPTRSMNKRDKFVMDVVGVFKGKYPFLRAADRGVENQISLTDGGLLSGSIHDTILAMKGYLEDEIRTIYSNRENGTERFAYYDEKTESGRTRGNSLRIFDGILSDSVKKEIYQLVDNAKNDKAFETGLAKILESNSVEKGINAYFNDEIASAIEINIKPTHLKDLHKDYGSNEEIISLAVQNIILGYIEQTKLFVGDLAFYKSADDAFKRFSMHNSPKKVSRVDASMLQELNELYSRSPRKDKKAPNNKIKSLTFADIKVRSSYLDMLREIFNEVIKDPVEVEKHLEIYSKMDEADGQAICTLDEFREIMLRAGDWNVPERVFQKAIEGEKLSLDELAYFNPQKLQYTGTLVNSLGRNIPAGRKFAVYPLIPSMIRGKALENLERQMKENQVGMAFFESASKFGFRLKEDGTRNQFYNNNGDLNAEGSIFEELDYRYMGIQQEMAPEVKNKVTQGTQFSVLKFSNMVQNGKAKEMHLNGEKKSSNEVQNIVNESISLDTEITNRMWKSLKNELGVAEEDGEFTITDAKKFVKFLESEKSKQITDENTLASIREMINSDGTLKPIESQQARASIENLIHALINNRVVRKKRFGGSKPQVASSGFHSAEMKRVKGKDGLYESSHLKFYRWNKDETELVPAEIMLPLPATWVPFVENIGGLEEFNRMIKEYSEGKSDELTHKRFDPQLLDMVTYRIPTAKLSYSDVFRVAEFLPPEAGELVVVPTEIVAKADSDFDIDKLNMYFANAIVGKHSIRYNSYLTGTNESALLEYYDKAFEPKKKFLESFFSDVGEMGRDAAMQKYEVTEEDYESFYQDFINSKSKDEFINSRLGKETLEVNSIQQLQNRQLEIEKAILLSKDNAFQMFFVNKTLLKELTNDVRAERNVAKEPTSLGSVVSFMNNLKKFENYLAGKDGISATAMHTTAHSMMQMANVSLNYPVFFKTPNKTSMSNITDTDGNLISETFAMFITAYVDIAKDPYIFDLNAGRITQSTIFHLVKLGMSPKTLAYFINQPLIREYVEERANAQSAFNSEFTSRKDIIESVAMHHGIQLPLYSAFESGDDINVNKEHTSSTNFSINELKKGIKGRNAEYQARMLDHFLLYESQAIHTQDLVRVLNANTKGVGKNFNELTSFQEALGEVMDDDIIKGIGGLLVDGSYMSRYQHVRNDSYEMLAKFRLPVQQVIENIKKIAARTQSTDEAKLKAKDKVDSEFVTYLMQKHLNTRFPLDKAYKKLFRGKDSVARDILAAKNHPKLKNNFLIQELYPMVGLEGVDDRVRLFKTRLKTWDINDLSQAFAEIEEWNKPLHDKLVYYNIIQSGFSNSFMNYMKVIPASTYNSILGEAIKKYESDPTLAYDFYEKFFFNNPEYVMKAKRSMEGNILPWHPAYDGPYIKYHRLVDGVWETRLVPRKVVNGIPVEKTLRDGTTKVPVYDLKNYIVSNITRFSSKQYAFTSDEKIQLTYNQKQTRKAAQDKRAAAESRAMIDPGEVAPGTGFADRLRAIAKSEQREGIPLPTEVDDPGLFSKDEFLEDYSQTTGKTIGETEGESFVERMRKLSGKYQLTNEQKRSLDNSLDSKVKGFLSDIGVEISTVDRIHDANGNPLDAIAKADMLRKVIEVVEGRADQTTLPEEAAHFFVEMFDGSPSVDWMIENIHNYPIYEQVVEEYKDVYDNDLDMRKEAVGKLIAQRMLDQNAMRPQEESFWKKIWRKIKELFSGVSSNHVQEFLDEYDRAAYKIMERKVDVNNMTTNELQGEFYQLPEQKSQKEILQKLSDGAKNVVKRDVDNKELGKKVPKNSSGKTERYFVDGKLIMNRVTDAQQRLFEKKLGKQVADKVNESENSKISRDTGTILHGLVEGFGNQIVNKTEKPSVPSIMSAKQHNALYNKTADVIQQIGEMQKAIDPAKKAVIKFEQFIHDPNTDTAGSTDILAIFSDGSASIFDFKFIEFATKNGKVIVDMINPLKEQSFDMQMKEYKRMLQDVYGISKFRQTRVVPINVQYQWKNEGDGSRKTSNLYSIETDGKTYLEQIPLANELTSDEKLNKLLNKLFKTKEKLQALTKTQYDNESLQTRLHNLRRGIRRLQLDLNIIDLLRDTRSVIDDVRANLEKMSLGDLQERRGTLEMYDMIDVYAQDSVESIQDETERNKIQDQLQKSAFYIKDAMQRIDQRIIELVVLRAEEYGVKNAARTFREVGNTPFKTLSEYDHPLFKTFYRAINSVQAKVREDRNNLAEQIAEKMEPLKALGGLEVFEKIINPETGNLITETSREFWKKRDDAIENKNLKWLKENFELTEENKEKLLRRREETLDRLKRISDDEGYIAHRMKQWDMKYNVLTEDSAYLSRDWAYITPVKKEENLSEAWKELNRPENKALLDFYNFFISKMDEFREYIPNAKFRKNFIPNIRKDMMELIMKNGLWAVAGIKDMITDSVAVREEDIHFGSRIDSETGETIYTVPTMFIKPFGENDYVIKNKSYDLGRSLLLFGEMAMSHKYLSEIEDLANSLKHVASISEQFVTNRDGKALTDKMGELIAGKGSVDTVNALTKFINFYIYGQRLQGSSLIGEKGDKIVSKAMQFVSIKALALNPVASAAALVGAGANAFMTGSKGTFYTKSGMLKSMGRMISEKDKHAAFKMFFEISQDNHTLLKANDLSMSSVIKHATVDTLFVGLRKADQFVEATVLGALLDNHTIVNGKVLKKRAGETSIWDSSVVENKKIQIKGADGSTLSDQEFQKFRNKAKKIVQTVRGNSTMDDISLAQTTLLGRALMQFRTWMPRLYEERMRNTRFDQDLDIIELGRYRTFWNEMMKEKVAPNLLTFMADVATFGIYKRPINEKRAKQEFDNFIAENPTIVEDSYGGDVQRAFEDYIESRRAQMRAMATEIRIILGVAAAIMAANMDWDDDGKKDIDQYAWANFAKRVMNRFDDELTFYFNPKSILSLLASPIPVLNASRSVWNLMRATGDDAVSIGELMFTGDISRDKSMVLHTIYKEAPITGQFYNIIRHFPSEK